MAQTFKFELVSPERLLVSEDVEAVIVPASEGEMTVMAQHAPTMTSVKPGVVTVRGASGENRFVVFGGFADIQPTACTLLAESAVPVKDIDKAAIDERIRDAREDLADAKDEDAKLRASDLLDHLTTLQAAI
ncbi:MAG TPA: F0F1 ATP synthase subunit epsilon [Rhizobiaceae bacterium]|nr:F0F1 ATP synthase subunit epsilon [Rhizobiaceae bacterium]